MIGGPDIPGRLGRKKCARSRRNVKEARRRVRRDKKKPSCLRNGGLPGSERSSSPRFGVYYSYANADGWVQESANRTAWPFDDDGSLK